MRARDGASRAVGWDARGSRGRVFERLKYITIGNVSNLKRYHLFNKK